MRGRHSGWDTLSTAARSPLAGRGESPPQAAGKNNDFSDQNMSRILIPKTNKVILCDPELVSHPDFLVPALIFWTHLGPKIQIAFFGSSWVQKISDFDFRNISPGPKFLGPVEPKKRF